MLAFSVGTVFSQIVDGRNFCIDGFAAYAGTSGTAWYHEGGTTGGTGGKVVYANTFSELQAYLQSSNPYIILVDHDITTGIKCYVDAISTGHLCDKQDGTEGVISTYGERIMVASNKTLIGVADPVTGKAPLFSRITFVMQCTHNVIIRNCRFTMVGAPILKSGENKIVAWRDGVQVEVGDPDCIGIQADAVSASKDSGSHIWVDHCEFFNGGAANKDRYDGLLDCKNNVQWLTFSYNYFHNHDKSCLWGKGDSDVYDNCRTISAHHNFFQNIDGSRLPLQRGGNVHYMNNYQENCSDGWDLRSQSVGYADACYFKSSKAPILPDGGGQVNICQDEGYGIIYDACQRVIKGTSNISYVNEPAKYDAEFNLAALNAITDWIPTKTWGGYFVNNRDKAADVPAICEKYSGAGKISIWEAYTASKPEPSLDEFKNALSTASTGNTYNTDGSKVSSSAVTQLPQSAPEINVGAPAENIGQGGGDNPGGGEQGGGTTGGEQGDIPSDGTIMIQSDNVPTGFALDGSATIEPYEYSSDLCRNAKLIKVVAGQHTLTLPSNMKVVEATLYAVGDNNTANKGKITELAGKTYSVNLPSRKEDIAFAEVKATDLNITGKLTFSVTYASGVKFSLKVEEISTGIKDVTSSSSVNGIIFDLQGRRIAQPTKGQLIIKEGKKHIAK